MPCDDCVAYPLCINYPDGTWRTVYDERQEEIARRYKSANDIDNDLICKKASEIAEKAIAKNKFSIKQQEINFNARNEQPMDISYRPKQVIQNKKPCKNC